MLARNKRHQKSNGAVSYFHISVCVLSLSAVSLCLSSRLNDHIDTEIRTHIQRPHMGMHTLILYINKLMTCAEQRTLGHNGTHGFTRLSVCWVNLFGRNWVWQSSSSAANNTETNELISSTPLSSPSPSCSTFALFFSLVVLPSVSVCAPLHISAVSFSLSTSLSTLLDILSLPAQMVSVTPLSLNYSVNYCGKMCN